MRLNYLLFVCTFIAMPVNFLLKSPPSITCDVERVIVVGSLLFTVPSIDFEEVSLSPEDGELWQNVSINPPAQLHKGDVLPCDGFVSLGTTRRTQQHFEILGVPHLEGNFPGVDGVRLLGDSFQARLCYLKRRFVNVWYIIKYKHALSKY